MLMAASAGCSSGNGARVSDACDLLTSHEVAAAVHADAQPGVLTMAIGESKKRQCAFEVSGKLGTIVVYLGQGDAPTNSIPDRALEVRDDTYVIVYAQYPGKDFSEMASGLAMLAIQRATRR